MSKILIILVLNIFLPTRFIIDYINFSIISFICEIYFLYNSPSFDKNIKHTTTMVENLKISKKLFLIGISGYSFKLKVYIYFLLNSNTNAENAFFFGNESNILINYSKNFII